MRGSLQSHLFYRPNRLLLSTEQFYTPLLSSAVTLYIYMSTNCVTAFFDEFHCSYLCKTGFCRKYKLPHFL